MAYTFLGVVAQAVAMNSWTQGITSCKFSGFTQKPVEYEPPPTAYSPQGQSLWFPQQHHLLYLPHQWNWLLVLLHMITLGRTKFQNGRKFPRNQMLYHPPEVGLAWPNALSDHHGMTVEGGTFYCLITPFIAQKPMSQAAKDWFVFLHKPFEFLSFL